MTTIDFVTNPFFGGGPRNIYILSNKLNLLGYDSSIIFFSELPSQKKSDIIERQFDVAVKKPTKLLGFINSVVNVADHLTFPLLPLFLFEQYVTRVAAINSHNAPDAFISTFWQSVRPTNYVATKKGIRHFYFVQADETGFSQNKTYKKMAERTYMMDLPRFTHSQWIKYHLDDKYGGETEYIGMGLDHRVFKPHIVEKEPTIFTIARNGHNKGFDVFAKAINTLAEIRKDFKVIIAGESKVVWEFEKNGELKFPFEFIGWIIDDNELAVRYSEAIFVNTGRFEALPMPPLEAMACGSSVIMTDMIGAREYAINNRNALLCPAGDYLCFAEKLNDILSSDTLRQGISQGGIMTAANYRWEKVMDRMVKFLGGHGLWL